MDSGYSFVQIGVGVSPAGIEIDDIFEGFELAVVHVGAGDGDVAKAGSLEGALVRFDMRHVIAAKVGDLLVVAHALAGVVELIVGEEREGGADGVAGGAVAFRRILEGGHASNLRRGKRILLALIGVLVKGRVAAEDGALKAGQGVGHAVEGDGIGPIHAAEKGPIRRVGAQFGNRGLVSFIHLQRVEDRGADLRFEAGGTAVPEQQRRVGRVDQAGGVAQPQCAAHADRPLFDIRESSLRAMAGGTGEGIVFGEPGVIKQPPAQGDGGLSGRVAGRDRERRQSQWNSDGNGRANGTSANLTPASADGHEQC